MVNYQFKKGVLLIAFSVLVMFLITMGNVATESFAGDGGKKYDLVIVNGRVIDPETGRDEIAAVAVKDGTIKKITAETDFDVRDAGRVVDAKGLVVSPGFINTHTHEGDLIDIGNTASPISAVTPVSALIVQDGITFWLGGNCGMSPTGINVPTGDGKALHIGDPDIPMSKFLDEIENVPLYSNYGTLSGNITLRSNMGLNHMENESDEQIERMKEILAQDLAAGSFGISYGAMYDMGTTRKSMFELARVSKQAGGMAASHTRYPTFNLKHLLGFNKIVFKRAITEAIDTCRYSRIPFIVSHITDMSQSDSARWVFETLDKAIKVEKLPLAGDIIGHDYLENDLYVLTLKGKIPISTLMKIGNYKVEQFYVAQDVYLDGELYMKKYEQFTIEGAKYLVENFDKVDALKEGKAGVGIFCDIIPPEDTKLRACEKIEKSR